MIFNRPDTTMFVFEKIREQRPRKLYVAADGPRAGMSGEGRAVEAVREGVLKGVDWPCSVRTLFQERNLGCKEAIPCAIDWFFHHESEGIILEDDCVPAKTFFRFCEEMLRRYRFETRVMMVAGTNFNLPMATEAAYVFSLYFPIWGWATWRRAWKHYDRYLLDWPTVRHSLSDYVPIRQFREMLRSHFDRYFTKSFDTWDAQWVYTGLAQKGLAIIPTRNLISNIGAYGTHFCGESATLFLPTFEFPEGNFPGKYDGKSFLPFDRLLVHEILEKRSTFPRLRRMTVYLSLLVRHLFRAHTGWFRAGGIERDFFRKGHVRKALIRYSLAPFFDPFRKNRLNQRILLLAKILDRLRFCVNICTQASFPDKSEIYDMVFDFFPGQPAACSLRNNGRVFRFGEPGGGASSWEEKFVHLVVYPDLVKETEAFVQSA